MKFKKYLKKMAGLFLLSAITLTASSSVFAGDAISIEEQPVNYDSFDELTEFAEEVTDLLEDDNLGKNGEFDLKRLLVLSETDAFDVQGAADVMSFDNLYILSYDSVRETKTAYKALSKDKHILSVEPDKLAEIAGAADAGDAKAPADYGKQKSDVTVAVLDTGYDTTYYKGNRILGSEYNVSGSGKDNSVQDDNGHGTVVSNIILDHSKANVLPLKVADNEGRTSGLRMYIGMKQAIASEADVINISMAAYKSSSSELMNSVITEAKDAGILTVVSAGNYGEDASNYSPANAKDAITVAAVKSDKTLDESSNYGDVVDYVAYGFLEVGGIGGEISESSGTSVSAAIVSGVAADVISEGNSKYADAMNALDALAEDLGNEKCGKGFLTADGMQPGTSTDNDGTTAGKSELLTCDWKSLSEEELNGLIEKASEIDAKRFLDDLSEEDKEKVLSMKDCYYDREVTSLVGEVDMESGTVKENKRFHGTYLEYLYSDYFKDYTVQKTVSDTGKNYFNTNSKGFAWYKIKGTDGKGKLVAKDTTSGGRKDDTGTISVTGTNGGGFTFNDMEFGSIVFGGGEKPTYVTVVNVGGKIGAHNLSNGVDADRPTGHGKSTECDTPVSKVIQDYPTAMVSGSACPAVCAFELAYSDADEEVSEIENGKYARTYTLKTKKAGRKDGTPSVTTTPGTCSVRGVKTTVTPKLCSICGHAVSGESVTTTADLGYAPHSYPSTWAPLNGTDHYHDCVNYAACSKSANNAGSRVTHNHDWQTIIDAQPNCTAVGKQHRYCPTCGAIDRTLPDIPALGHDWYWHAGVDNNIQNGHLWVQCDRPGCNEGNPTRDNAEIGIVTHRYRLVLEKDQNTKSVSQTATESLSDIARLGKTDRINALDISTYHSASATTTLTAVSNIGYHVIGWNSVSSYHSEENPSDFAMPQQAVSITASSAINTSTLVVNPAFKTDRYKTSCDAFWEDSSNPQSFGPKNWHSTKDIPVPTRTGYDFAGWTLTSDHPNDGPGTMSTLVAAAVFTYGSDRAAESVDTLTANWTPRNDTKYVIRHWQQNLAYDFDKQPNGYDTFEMDDYENYYILADTENLQGQSDKALKFNEITKSYKGFHFVGGRTNTNDGPFVITTFARILPDGKTEIDLFYARNRYQVDVPTEGYGDTTITGEIGKTGNPSGDWFLYGDDVTVTYEPNDGWCTKYIEVDGTKIEGADFLPYIEEYKFPDIDADHTVKVVFKRLPHLNITSLCGTDKDAVTAWCHVQKYRVTGTDYLGRERMYLITTEDFDKPSDMRVLPGEYVVTPEPMKPWYTIDGSVDQFQKGDMTDAFAITVDVMDCKDNIADRKAPTASFQYTFMPDWEYEGDYNVEVNKLK